MANTLQQRLSLLAAFGLLRPICACNGISSFCELPFARFTFPGTHNSGAFSLNIPDILPDDVPGVDVNEALRCMFENHDMNFLEQLNFGIRSFNLDLCHHAETPDVLYNCHGSGAQTAWGDEFTKDLDAIHTWMGLHTQELVVMAPGNLHVTRAATRWESLFANKFGGTCREINENTDPSSWYSSSEIRCGLLTGRPNENVALGSLVKNNVRLILYPLGWGANQVYSTYSELVQPGATSKSLLEDFEAYAAGFKPLPPETRLLFEVFGSAKMPNLEPISQCGQDPVCYSFAVKQVVDELELRCVKALASGYNTDLLQDDTNPHAFQTGEECPEYSCGCLGYRSPLEVVHHKLLKQGHAIQAVHSDYPEKGASTQIAEVTRRMNEANLRHFRGESELGASWISCHWQPMTAVGAPTLLLVLCVIYTILACLYPKKWGVCCWSAWHAFLERKEARKRGLERGREEARKYLANERGDGPFTGPGVAPTPQAQQLPPIQVNPYQANPYYPYPGGFRHDFQPMAETE